MEPSEYLALLRKHWLMIAMLGVIGFVGGYAYSQTIPPSYRATASLFVSEQAGATVGESLQGSTYAQNRIESYAQLATKAYVLDPVIQELGLDTTARSLAHSVEATSPINSLILDISAVSGNPAKSADIANTVSTELARAVERIEGAGSDDDTTPHVGMTVISPATAPSFAFTPNTKLNAATGLVVGLAIGVVLALARTILDTRVRTQKDIRRVSDVAVLSTVRYDRKSAHEAAVMRSQPFGDQAEAYRRLRTNLRYLNLRGPNRSIVVTSSLPTEGKTTTSINLAWAMAEGGARVLLVDADLRRPSIARHLGIEGTVGLTTVLIGEATVADVVQRWGDMLDVLPSGQVPPNPSELLDSTTMVDLLADLAASYDVVILDSAPLLPVTDAAVLSRLTDGALVVVGSKRVHRHQLADGLATLSTAGGRVLGLVFNRVSGKDVGATYVYGSTPHATARTHGKDARPQRVSRRPRANRGEVTAVGTSPVFPKDIPVATATPTPVPAPVERAEPAGDVDELDASRASSKFAAHVAARVVSPSSVATVPVETGGEVAAAAQEPRPADAQPADAEPVAERADAEQATVPTEQPVEGPARTAGHATVALDQPAAPTGHHVRAATLDEPRPATVAVLEPDDSDATLASAAEPTLDGHDPAAEPERALDERDAADEVEHRIQVVPAAPWRP
ncbi:polysaccharide biosynthesis tyrosine autokinase [Cellulomonas sp. P5_C5]